MEKYGYKNISSSSEFEKASKNDGKFQLISPEMKHLTNSNFVKWTEEGNFGMPGQTRYEIKSIEDLLHAGENASKGILKERNPNGYVGW
jgi:hypothetical protein